MIFVSAKPEESKEERRERRKEEEGWGFSFQTEVG